MRCFQIHTQYAGEPAYPWLSFPKGNILQNQSQGHRKELSGQLASVVHAFPVGPGLARACAFCSPECYLQHRLLQTPPPRDRQQAHPQHPLGCSLTSTPPTPAPDTQPRQPLICSPFLRSAVPGMLCKCNHSLKPFGTVPAQHGSLEVHQVGGNFGGLFLFITEVVIHGVAVPRLGGLSPGFSRGKLVPAG